MLRSALAYTEKFGWRVFPCHNIQEGKCSCGNPDCGSPGKHPRTKNGLIDATINQGQIRSWWERWPDANIGYALPSDRLVLDIDNRPGVDGADTLAELEQEHGKLPETVTCLTGGGGVHYYFRIGQQVKNGTNVFPGIDIRTKGGYVILPPSGHITGRVYDWDADSRPGEVDIADAPDWLQEALGQKPTGKKSPSSSPPEAKVGQGSRNATLFTLASSLRTRGLSEDAMLAALLEENRAR